MSKNASPKTQQTQPEGLSAPPLFVPLRREYFEAFEQRKKKEEYRPYGPRWNEKTCHIGRRVVLSLGYGKQRRLTGTITSFDRSGGITRTPAWLACYAGKGYTTAACIGITLD